MSNEIKYYYYPEDRPNLTTGYLGAGDPYKWDREHDIVTQDQIDAKYAKFDKEDEDNLLKSSCQELNIQLAEEKEKNKELSQIVLDHYRRINELNEMIQGYKNTLKSVGLIIGSVKSKEYPNQGAESPFKESNK